LLDENISPAIAQALGDEYGIDVCHVRDRGLLAATDSQVLDKAYSEDRILVTANVGDFVALVRSRELHAGLILLENGELLRDEQLAVLRLALDALRTTRDMVNRVLRVGADGVLALEELPGSESS